MQRNKKITYQFDWVEASGVKVIKKKVAGKVIDLISQVDE